MAQALSLEELEAEEARLLLPQFTFEDGHALASAAIAHARTNNLAIAGDVFCYGQVIAHLAMPGTAPDNGHWIKRKRNTVLRTGHSSLYMGRLADIRGIPVFEDFALNRKNYALHGGSIPIRLQDGGLIGAFTVSGLPHLQDHGLAVELLKKHF
jgi:uncharacterized protein (UPF0303 family)